MMAAGVLLVMVIVSTSCSEEVKKVELSSSTLTLNVGDTAVLTATVLPDRAIDKTVIWTSSNPAVAIVGISDGIVRAVKEGTTTITVTTVDGGKIANCEVTVKKGVSKVRFRKESRGYGDVTGIRITFFHDETEYEYIFGTEGGISNYFEISPGDYEIEFQLHGDLWLTCAYPDGHFYYYNFRAGRKYTIVGEETSTGPVFSVIDDGGI